MQTSFVFHMLRFFVQLLFPSSYEESRILSLTPADFSEAVVRRHDDAVSENPKIRSPFLYRDPLIKSAVQLAKYRGKKGVCRMLGQALWDVYGEDLSAHALLENIRWVVIPVPISREKKRTRGYNQSEEIAHGFLERADKNAFVLDTRLIRKVSSRESQTKTKTRRERRKNAKGSFIVVSPDAVRTKDILLIDDVVTTGATLADAARVLHQAGARRILCITVAH